MEGPKQPLSLMLKYFCHHCQQVITIKKEIHESENPLICPHCHGDFIEEISEELYDNSQSGSDDEDDDDQYEYSDSFSDIERESVLDGRRRPFIPSEELRTLRDQVMFHIVDNESNGFQDFEFRPSDPSTESIVDAITSQLLDEVVITGPPPLSKEEIQSLTTMNVNKELLQKGIQCTVCLEDFRLRQKIKCLPCNHMYHNKCIGTWLSRQSSCPNCREVVTVPHSSRSRSNSSRSSGSSDDSDFHLPGVSSISDFFTTSINPFRLLL